MRHFSTSSTFRGNRRVRVIVAAVISSGLQYKRVGVRVRVRVRV